MAAVVPVWQAYSRLGLGGQSVAAGRGVPGDGASVFSEGVDRLQRPSPWESSLQYCGNKSSRPPRQSPAPGTLVATGHGHLEPADVSLELANYIRHLTLAALAYLLAEVQHMPP